ncbi:MAG: hypothetical protein ACI9C1_001196 [Candidatus Aldehydirespiratoraceae bacterium]|jgi:hypothetical protein
MHSLRRLLATLLFISLIAASCSDDTDASDTADDDTSAEDTVAEDDTAVDDTAETEVEPVATASSCDEIAALFVTKGSANADLADPEVSASCEGDTLVVISNGIPDYTYIETSPGSPNAVDLSYSIPATPTVADETTDVPALGSAAVAINGVPIYGPTEAQGADVGSLAEGVSECGSHNGPTGFHMHLFGTSTTTDCMYTAEEVAAAPQLIGYAFDGYPIYTGNDQYTSSWELTDESLFASDTWSAHSFIEGSGDLDECNGLTDTAGNYAYYTTNSFPYVLGCYTGVVDLDGAGGGLGELGGPPPDDE